MIKANYTIYECVAFSETNNNIECGGMFSKCLQMEADFETKWNELNWKKRRERMKEIKHIENMRFTNIISQWDDEIRIVCKWMAPNSSRKAEMTITNKTM